MPRLLYFCGVALLVLCGAFLLADHLLTPPPGITEANVRRIKPGMTVRQAAAILDGHAGRAADYATDPTRVWIWDGAGGSAWVQTDGASRVVDASWLGRDPTPGDPRFRDSMGRIMGQ